MKSELVTIGITCYNAEDTIGRAIESATAQDWPRSEIVIVDDCSSDRSLERIRSYLNPRLNIRLIEHAENGGAAVARNTILENASGEFVAFFDDDDESLPTRIRTQIMTLKACEAKHPEKLIACYAGGERKYPNGYIVPAPAIGREGPPPHGPAVADYLLFFRRIPGWFYGAGVPTCALLARRSTFDAAGGFDPEMRRNQDVALAVELALRGGYFVGTREKLYIRHMTPGLDKSARAARDARLKLAEKFRPYLESVGRYEYAVRWPRIKYWHAQRRYDRFMLELLKLFLRYPVASLTHLLQTGPKRLFHERQMRKSLIS